MSRFFEQEAGDNNRSFKTRNWVFTLNNYTEDERSRIETHVVPECEYICYQPEVGEERGTPHLQGCVFFKSQRTLAGLRRMFGTRVQTVAGRRTSGGTRVGTRLPSVVGRRGVGAGPRRREGANDGGGILDDASTISSRPGWASSTSFAGARESAAVGSSTSGTSSSTAGHVSEQDDEEGEEENEGRGRDGGINCRFRFAAMRGTAQQAIDYCNKEETRDTTVGFGFCEWGVRPSGQGTRSDISALVTSIQNGKRGRVLFEEHPGEFIKYTRGVDKACSLYDPVRATPTRVYWFHGPTGTGKSRAALEEGGVDAYWKNPTDYWWDGYSDQECVIIDDYRKDFCKFSDLLRLFDRYPLRLNVKGSTVSFMAKRIYVTSPKDPEETWSGRTDEDLAQLMRRITEVRYFPGE